MASSKFNPYAVALSLLTETLESENIPLVDNKKQPEYTSIPEEGFNCDKLKTWLTDYQRSNTKTKRTLKNYNAYEVLQCPRQSYYLRQGAPFDGKHIAKYPYSTIKASMGEVVEKLLLSIYNQVNGTKWRNGVRLNWNPVSYGLQYPFNMVIDGISYDEDIILDCKFTDTPDDFHINQVKLYAMAWEEMYHKNSMRYVEVIYLNSSMNSINVRREAITDETRQIHFENTKKRIQLYDYNLKNNILPEPEKHNCNFCLYQSICKKNENYIDCQKVTDIQKPSKELTETELKLTNIKTPSKDEKQSLTILI